MKYLTLVLLLIPFVVNADPRCNEDIGTAHYPYDPVDTDNEYKFSSKVGLKEVSGQGAVACYAIVRFEAVPYHVAPEPSATYGRDSSANCTMVNDDGAETQTSMWQSIVRRICKTDIGKDVNSSLCEVSYELRCGRFVPRYEE